METLFRLLLTLHILGGLTALATGYGAIWVKRGGRRHRQLGHWYVRGMMLVLLTEFPMSLIHPNPFLFGIVFFTAYFVWAGRSAALNRSGQPTGTDKLALAIFLGGSALALIALGWAHFFAPTFNPTFTITGLVFAVIAVAVGLRDVLVFRGGAVAGRLRIQRHLVNMCAGLIATTTAVLVTLIGYVPDIPPIVAWLGPTGVIVPFITYWSRQMVSGTYKF